MQRRGWELCRQWRRTFSTARPHRFTRDGHRRLVLGIESSCDDSCASLVSAPVDYFQTRYNGAEVHNSIVLKQDHGLTNGIEPLIAANAHSANVPLAIHQSLVNGQETGVLRDASTPSEIDAVAVTSGPGMRGSLSQGLSAAKLLATLWDRPLIYVHHMVAHTLTPFLSAQREIKMPFLVLLLSGGHTQLVVCHSPTQFKILATSHDNSIGETTDKVARMLQISTDWSQTSPGAALERFASPLGAEQYKLPVPLRNRPEFSYSGLKSAVSRLLEVDESILSSEAKRRSLAHAFQQAAFAQIQDKIKMAFEDGGSRASLDLGCERGAIKDLVVSGGVASNRFLRRCVDETLESIGRGEVRVHFPPISLCTDNAAMIAHAALISWDITRDLAVKPRAKWSVEELCQRLD